MAYTPTVWKNGEFPPIDAEHLNKIEQGIADAVSVTPQTLTNEQKAQARGNIGAGPDSAVLYTPQALTNEQKAQARTNIGADTVQGAVLYTPQTLTNEQKAQARTNIGADAVQGAVLYTPQTLTSEQKVQALQNISAAPGWYGLGGGAHFLTAADNLDNFPQAGWYGWHESVPQNGLFQFCSCLVLNCGNELVTHQILYTADSYELRRMYNGGAGGWHPWEWVDPPMNPGDEYRTTERYRGKPVYKKLVHLGTLGSGGKKEFYPFGENYVAGDYNVFSVEFHLSNFESDGGWTMTLPHIDSTTQQTVVEAQWTGTRVEFYVSTNELADYHGFALMKYTKATD